LVTSGPNPRRMKKNRGDRSGTNWPISYVRGELSRQAKIIPHEYDTKLEFTYASTLNNTVGAAVSRRFTPNAAYDVDPTLGSTSTPGFSELATLFNYYRVVGYSYSIEMVNKETFPVLFVVTNTNLDPGTSGLGSYMGNALTQSTLVSGSAGGPCRYEFAGTLSVVEVVGSKAVELDDNYASLTSSLPTNKIWSAIGVDGLGSTLTNGCGFLVRYVMHVRFFERKLLSS